MAVVRRRWGRGCFCSSWRRRSILFVYSFFQGVGVGEVEPTLRRRITPGYSAPHTADLLAVDAVRGGDDSALHVHRLPRRLLHRAGQRTPSQPASAAGNDSVLDELPHPHVCLVHDPAAAGPAQWNAAGVAHHSQRHSANGSSCSTPDCGDDHARLYLSAVHDSADLRERGKDRQYAAGSRIGPRSRADRARSGTSRCR